MELVKYNQYFDVDTQNNSIGAGQATMHFIPIVREASGSIYGVVGCNFGNPPYVNAVHTGGSSYYNQVRTDENGYGNFQYQPPSGYYALCTQNLAEFG